MKWLRSCAVRLLRVTVLSAVAAVAVLLASSAAASPMRHAVSSCTPGYDCGLADLQLQGTVDPMQAAVGDTLTWRLTVNDNNTQPALNVYVDITLPANVTLTYSSTDRGTGCAPTSATTLHCNLDWLADTAQFGHVTLATTITATGDHTLTAVTGYSSPSGPVADPSPADNTLTLTATTPTPPPPPAPVMPVIESPVLLPGPIAGSHVTVGFWVLRSDNGARLTEGTMTGSASVAGRALKYAKKFKSGYAWLTFVIPKTAKGKQLKVKVTITANGQTASKAATYTVS